MDTGSQDQILMANGKGRSNVATVLTGVASSRVTTAPTSLDSVPTIKRPCGIISGRSAEGRLRLALAAGRIVSMKNMLLAAISAGLLLTVASAAQEKVGAESAGQFGCRLRTRPALKSSTTLRLTGRLGGLTCLQPAGENPIGSWPLLRDALWPFKTRSVSNSRVERRQTATTTMSGSRIRMASGPTTRILPVTRSRRARSSRSVIRLRRGRISARKAPLVARC